MSDQEHQSHPKLIVPHDNPRHCYFISQTSRARFTRPARTDLAALGQTTQVRRSSLAEVQERIALLRTASRERVTSRTFDFDVRLAQVRKAEEARRAEKREAKKRKRAGAGGGGDGAAAGAGGRAGQGVATVAGTKGAFGNRAEVEAAEREAEAMAQMMGFGGFGGGVKGKR